MAFGHYKCETGYSWGKKQDHRIFKHGSDRIRDE
jgi:hypothetical protein